MTGSFHRFYFWSDAFLVLIFLSQGYRLLFYFSFLTFACFKIYNFFLSSLIHVFFGVLVFAFIFCPYSLGPILGGVWVFKCFILRVWPWFVVTPFCVFFSVLRSLTFWSWLFFYCLLLRQVLLSCCHWVVIAIFRAWLSYCLWVMWNRVPALFLSFSFHQWVVCSFIFVLLTFFSFIHTIVLLFTVISAVWRVFFTSGLCAILHVMRFWLFSFRLMPQFMKGFSYGSFLYQLFQLYHLNFLNF